MVEVEEYLPSMSETLASTPNITKTQYLEKSIYTTIPCITEDKVTIKLKTVLKKTSLRKSKGKPPWKKIFLTHNNNQHKRSLNKRHEISNSGRD